MCEPVSLAAATTALSLYQQDQVAKGTNEFNSATFKGNRERATREGALATSALISRTMQERTAASVENQKVQSQTDYAISQASNALLESGASGASARAVVREFSSRGAKFQGGQNINRKIADAQFTAESTAINSQTQGRIESARRAKVARPSFLNALVQIGGSAAGAYFSTPGYKAKQLANASVSSPLGSPEPFYGVNFQQG